MKSTKIINLVGLAKTISTPVEFPLNEETLGDIAALKLAFRNSFEEHQVYSLGMAAPQIGVFKRFFIMPKQFSYGSVKSFKRLKHLVRNFNVYINPKILQKSPEVKMMNEYCLSVGINEYKVVRPREVNVEYTNEEGEKVTQTLDELRSRIFQHEYDHLDGILMSELENAKMITKGPRRK